MFHLPIFEKLWDAVRYTRDHAQGGVVREDPVRLNHESYSDSSSDEEHFIEVDLEVFEELVDARANLHRFAADLIEMGYTKNVNRTVICGQKKKKNKK